MRKRKDNGEFGTSQGKIIQINEEQIKGHLDEMVRGTVEEREQACSGLLQRGMRNISNPRTSQNETGNQGTFYSGKKRTS